MNKALALIGLAQSSCWFGCGIMVWQQLLACLSEVIGPARSLTSSQADVYQSQMGSITDSNNRSYSVLTTDAVCPIPAASV